MRLKGRIALVTGSQRGIGAGIAARLARDGAKVVVHDRVMTDELKAVAAELKADIVLGDLETAEAPARIVQEAFALHGAIDILVCNAAVSASGEAVTQNIAAIDRVLAVDLRAVMLSVIEFAKLTKSPHGRAVLISSGAANNPSYGASLYAAAKAGVEAFARSVAQELGPRGITVNAVAPGTTVSPFLQNAERDPDDWPEEVKGWTALRRLGQPDDIADIVAFLASDEGRWLTGVTVPANGGLVVGAANIIVRNRQRRGK